MEKNKLWEEIGDYTVQIVNAVAEISQRSYISITDLKTSKTWWSQNAVDMFGIDGNFQEYAKEKPILTIYPNDIEKYRQGFRDRMKGIDLDVPLEYRVITASNENILIRAMCKMIQDPNGENRYLLVEYGNHGIPDDIDSVTGLYTGIRFSQDIEKMLKQRKQAVAIKIGIDNFSHMNVMYGSEYADKLLERVADELRFIVYNRGVVYRLSGAKFAVVFEQMSRDELKRFYRDVVGALDNRIYLKDTKVPLRASAGAMFLDNYTLDANSVKSRLAYSLNLSKHAHHGNLFIFNDEMGNGKDQLELMSVIHKSAVEDCNGFFLCYQPIADASTGEIKGMEALLRWAQDPYGVVSPAVFIDWLEKDPCIFELGNWIIRQALHDVAEISKIKPGFFVNVNISATQIVRSEFRTSVLQILEMSGVPASQFCMELTERCRELDIDFLRGEIEFFKSSGIKVAMDDFGTGNASLQVALELPVDELKIDMSFVRDIRNKPFNQALVQSIVEFAQRAGLETCIEGVEDEKVLEYLKPYGATWHQGYYFSRPVKLEEFKDLLQKNMEQ